MTPDEVIEALKRDFNIDISPSTLSRYARQGVTPKPVVRSLGRGEGRESEYTQEQFAEIVASCWLIHHEGARPVEVADVRRLALQTYDLDAFFEHSHIQWGKPEVITFEDVGLTMAFSPKSSFARQPSLDWLFNEFWEPIDAARYGPRSKPTRQRELLWLWLQLRALATGNKEDAPRLRHVLRRGADGLYRMAAEVYDR